MDDSGDMFGNAAGVDVAGADAADRPLALGLEEPSQPAVPVPQPDPAAQPYRVLARKYRPRTFSELIGQEPMVQTLGNAIRRGRLAHAFLMTGVRGVGKTSTARLIAKALNCIGPDGSGGPTIDPCGVCEPCVAIAEGRHIDVIEMDAASHTGVDDVREIIEAVRYAAVSARYKIYIIDEVHMLSRNAFNALLKTLEEPPPHVKFLFATTEVDKLPVTVLSRCQRFDLRRIATPQLAAHFAWICGQEAVSAEPEALAMIAAAAEGSVRDGLSILDQAIAHADLERADNDAGLVTAAQVQEMLGLADKGVARAMLASLLGGNGAAVLAATDAQYALGVEPLALLRGVMALVNRVTVAQVSGSIADAASAEEHEALEGWAKALGAGQLHRLWQLLLKGHEEVKAAPEPLAAAQMALLRVLHAADLPDPGELARRLEAQVAAGVAAQASAGGAAAAVAPVVPAPEWRALVERVEESGRRHLANEMRAKIRVVALAVGTLDYALAPNLPGDPGAEIRKALVELTGTAWTLTRVETGGTPSLLEQEDAARQGRAEALRRQPLVAAAFAAFPDAQFVRGEDATPISPHQQRNRA